MKNEIIQVKHVQKKIYTIRDVYVMLDSDLAEIYRVETRVLNQAVKRNLKRFPEDFMFQLTKEEWENLISQFVISSAEHGGRRKLPYVFTEHGVSMLSAVLKSDVAVEVSVNIIRAFVQMRKFLIENAAVFRKIAQIENKLLTHDKNFEKIFKALESREINRKQGIFFNGQVFDAYKFVSDLIRSAKKSIILIDNYIDDTVLTLFAKREKEVAATIYTKKISKQLKLDIQKFNRQYNHIEIKKFSDSHDRFLIIDNKTVYHFGASLKDLGKKWFAFSKFDINAVEILNKLK